MFTVEHIDPRNGVLISGLENRFNEILASGSYNSKKINRFVPYRVCNYPSPVNEGDTGEFLIGADIKTDTPGEWVVCEFMVKGSIWWYESNKIGNGHVHSEEWKVNNSKIQRESWKTRDKSQIQSLGKGDHKRNPGPGQRASCLTGHPHKRKHWDKDLFDEVESAYLNRTSYHWGRKELCEKYGVTTKTVENMVKHINKGKTLTDIL